jgi:hypothetical protein
MKKSITPARPVPPLISTVSEAAAYLGVPPKAVRDAMESGDLRALGRNSISKGALRAYVRKLRGRKSRFELREIKERKENPPPITGDRPYPHFPPRGQPTGFVYFVQAGTAGPIKIGYARNVRARLDNLQVACPHRLYLLLVVPGTHDHEKRFHAIFAGRRLRGEWFSPTVELIEFIGYVGAACTEPI